jgi:hypothetical protein
MKKVKVIGIILVLLGTVFTVFAQTNGGDILIGASSSFNFNYNHQTDVGTDWYGNPIEDNYSGIGLNISPFIGVFVVKGLSIGLDVPLSYSTTKTEDNDKLSVFNFSVGPFIRYYFNTPMFKPFIHTQFGYSTYNYHVNYSDPDIEDDKYDINSLSYKFGAGLAIFITEKLSLDIMGSYNYIDYIDNSDDREWNIGADLGFSIVL